MKMLFIITALICMSLSQTCIGQKPDPRWSHGVCYDAVNKAVLLFGGSGPGGYLGDLWSLSKGGWKKLSDTGPSPRSKFAFAYDEKRKRAVLFGGSGANDELFSDTWEWDGQSWTKIDVAGPTQRDHPLAGYDPQSETIIIKGGFNSTGLLSDTWSFDGTKWTELKDAGSAGKGLAHGMFVDESANRLTLITVEMNNNNQPRLSNSWWTLNKKKWEAAGKEFPSTSNQSIQAIAAAGKGSIMIFDGDDISNNSPATSWLKKEGWKKQNVTGPRPRVGHAMVWDPSRKAVILFGGFDRKAFFNDTWMWQKEKWVEQK